MLLASSPTTSAEGLPRINKLTPTQVADCLSKGGRVTMAGLSVNEMCEVPFADAGKTCRGSKDCLGACLLEQPEWPGKEARPGAKAVGKCQPTNSPYGCYTRVENGRVEVGICVD